MSDCGCDDEISNQVESRTLITLLGINASMALIEAAAGWYAESTGLMADALDMLADAMIYATALYAIGKSTLVKANAALLTSFFQLLLGTGVVAEVLRRFIYGSDPVSIVMIGVSLFALAANITCLALLHKHKHGEVHMRATWICTRTDVIANFGVIGAGIMVMWMGSPVPDLLIGLLISGVVLQGSYRIFRDSMITRRKQAETR